VNGAILEEILNNPGLNLINDRSFTRKNNILDLFISSPSVAHKIQDFFVDEFSCLDSDHHPVHININLEFFVVKEINNPRLNFKKADWVQYRNTLNLATINPDYDIDALNEQICSNILIAVKKSIPFLPKKSYDPPCSSPTN
jgi:hypothetical protein